MAPRGVTDRDRRWRAATFAAAAVAAAIAGSLILASGAAAVACPNEALRAEANSDSLPECRAYELVSEGDGQGIGVTGIRDVAGAGSAAIFTAPAFGEPSNLASLFDPDLARRTPAGWRVVAMPPSPDRFLGNNFGNYWPAADLGSILWSKGLAGEEAKDEVLWQIAAADGSVTPASMPIVPLLREAGSLYYTSDGASADLDRYVFSTVGSSRVALLPGEDLVGSNSNLYVITGARSGALTLDLVNRTAAGEQIGGACGAALGGFHLGDPATHAVSRDGATVYFSARPGEPVSGACDESSPIRIFERFTDALGQVEVVEASRSECDRQAPAQPCTDLAGDDVFQAAAADGSQAFLTTSRQLTDSDTDSTADVYSFDAEAAAGSRLTQVSAGEPGPLHTVGSGAEALGILDTAADGSRVYFVARGILAGANSAGDEPVQGADNLYAYDRDGGPGGGLTSFIAALPPADESLWGSAPPGDARSAFALPATASPGVAAPGDGRFLLFVSSGRLDPGEDSDEQPDLYRFDDLAKQLRCLSCLGNGAFPVSISRRVISGSPADYVETNQVASADVSEVVFTTAEPLPGTGDANEAYDLYLWTEAGVKLLSGGTGATGIAGESKAPPVGFLSADGVDAYFMTTTSVVSADADGERKDVYTAHVDGGFAQPREAAPCASEASCRGPASSASDPGAPASAKSPGEGNPPPPPPRCRPGTVRRHGRCRPRHRHRRHRRRVHHHRRKHRRADHENRRAHR